MTMVDTISLSWEWIIGILFTLIMAFLSWLLKQFYDLKKDFEQRMRFLENENSNKNGKIDLLEKINLKPFAKGEKEK